jgi:hypothetical protein
LKLYAEEKILEFIGSEETIAFMHKFIKWFEIHYVSNLTQAILKRLPNKVPFNSNSDERLLWLEEFLEWLQDWKNSARGKDDS